MFRAVAPILALLALGAALSPAVRAQSQPQSPSQPAEAPARLALPGPMPPVETAATGPHASDARIEHLVTEDSQVRIEEERVRGQVRQITVHSKLRGMGSYEIAPAEPGRDPAQDTKAGKRIWWTFDF